jgi:uncharacterized membrane protein SpoIIM required for sporulation
MRIGDVLDQRRASWAELERMCNEFRKMRSTKRGMEMMRFSELYRAACSDLAMADAYQLPPTTIEYLHRLVGRAHNLMYRSQRFQFERWMETLWKTAPQQIFSDPCVQISSVMFFGILLLSALFAWNPDRYPGFAEKVLGKEQIEQFEEMYDEPLAANFDHYIAMSSFYIQHNTGIGLKCFATGPLIFPTVLTLCENAVSIGTVFGYMARSDVPQGENFFHFVTAHGPFELTAIVLSAAAGLRLGIGLVMTAGFRRYDSLRLQTLRALPVIMTAVVLFVLAAFTEGFISPSPMPYLFKAAWSMMASFGLMFYFVVLGFPRGDRNAA